MRKSLCLNVLHDSNSVLSWCMCLRGSVCVCVGGGGGAGGGNFLDNSTAVCVVETFTSSFQIKAKPEKHIFIT